MSKTMELVFNLNAVSSKFVGGFNNASNVLREFNVDILATKKKISELEKSQKALNQMNDRAKASNIYKQQRIEIDRLADSLKNLQKQKSKLETLNTFKHDLKASGYNMLKAAAWGLPAVYAARSAMHMESGMADVQKTVKFHSAAEMKQMEQDIINLSTKMPMSTEEISKIVAFGGQAGVANHELMDFTKNAAKMGVAFNISAEQAGETMEQWRTAFKMTVPEAEELANKISYLGHNSTASASKISEVVRRIAALGNVAGVSSGDVAAIGAAIVGAGITEDVAATGVKHLLTSMTLGSANSKKTRKAYQALGFDPDELAKLMQTDSRSAISKVMKALQNTPKETALASLKEIFGMEAIGSLAPLLTNLGVMQNNLDAVNDKTKYGQSLNYLYGIQSETTASKMQIMKNEVEALSIKMGETLLPSIRSGVGLVTVFLDGFNKFNDAHPNYVKAFELIAGAVIALNFVMSANPLVRALMLGGAAVTGLIALKDNNMLPNVDTLFDKFKGMSPPSITPKQNARGGIWNYPILTTFAENGPEAAIPLTGNRSRAISLWQETGNRLGLGGGSPAIFSPTIHIAGNTDRSMVEEVLKEVFVRFEDMMNNYQSKKDRVSYD